MGTRNSHRRFIELLSDFLSSAPTCPNDAFFTRQVVESGGAEALKGLEQRYVTFPFSVFIGE